MEAEFSSREVGFSRRKVGISAENVPSHRLYFLVGFSLGTTEYWLKLKVGSRSGKLIQYPDSTSPKCSGSDRVGNQEGPDSRT
jgi:hypothetical protein